MSEPWSYGTLVEGNVRNYISLRYRLLPYIYSTFYEAHTTGHPVSRSLVIDNTFDEKCWYLTYQNEFMFGPSILVAPVESTKELTKVYLPKGDWFDFFSGKHYPGQMEIMVECPLSKLPVFVKAGSFIPMQSITQSTSVTTSDTLFVHLYIGRGYSEFTYYEDDGITLENEQGKFMTKVFRFDPQHRQIVFESTEGPFVSKFSKIALVMHGFPPMQNFRINDTPVTPSEASIDLLSSLPDNDPLYTITQKYLQEVRIVSFNNEKAKTVIEW